MNQTVVSSFQQVLRGECQPLYVLLDGAADPRIVGLLRESREEYQSLYDGKPAEDMANFAPYLARLAGESTLFDALMLEGRSKHWGVFLTCAQPLEELRKHLRRFLMVELPNGKKVLFRYYDPRVLRAFLPTCTAAEAVHFFGPVEKYLVPGDKPEEVFQFSIKNGNLEKDKRVLA